MFTFKELDIKQNGNVELVFEGQPAEFMGIEGVRPVVRTGLNTIFNVDDGVRKIHEFEDGAWDQALVAASRYQSSLKHG